MSNMVPISDIGTIPAVFKAAQDDFLKKFEIVPIQSAEGWLGTVLARTRRTYLPRNVSPNRRVDREKIGVRDASPGFRTGAQVDAEDSWREHCVR